MKDLVLRENYLSRQGIAIFNRPPNTKGVLD